MLPLSEWQALCHPSPPTCSFMPGHACPSGPGFLMQICCPSACLPCIRDSDAAQVRGACPLRKPQGTRFERWVSLGLPCGSSAVSAQCVRWHSVAEFAVILSLAPTLPFLPVTCLAMVN